MKSILSVLGVVLCLAVAPRAQAQIRIVTTTPTLADIAHQVGGEHVDVESIMRGHENPHNVIPKPSFIVMVRKADLFVHLGLDAEPWVPELLKGTRQARLHPGNEANVNVSRGITLMEVPQRGELTRARGDIHIFGNPHYVLDPLNGVTIARTITEALKQKDPEHAAEFESNFEDFASRVQTLTAQLVARMKPYAGTEIVTYHRVWPYFLERFGLVKAAEIEPKPGIQPGPGHLSRVVETMRERGVRIIVVETFNSLANAESVAARGGGKAIVLPTEVNAVPEADSYEALFEHNVKTLIQAFSDVGIEPKPAATEGATSGGDHPDGNRTGG
jgi:ABC-type Zn uptake system ZnuABC Zn-binding protein ZnuA